MSDNEQGMTFPTVLAYINQRVPIFQYAHRVRISPSQQDELVNHFNQFSNKYYVQHFLKSLITIYERTNIEVSESLYELYCSPEILNARALKPTDFDNIVYHINQRDIIIGESPSIISGQGTTGLRTWEAASFLAKMVPCLEIGGTVCELGTGTGLVGISLTGDSRIRKVLFTDGDTNLFDNLVRNQELNQVSREAHSISQLLWGNDHHVPETDYLVAADVTYDRSILEELVCTISRFLANGCKKCYIAATVRNIDTVNEFEERMQNHGLKWDTIETFDPQAESFPVPWYRPTTPYMNLYSIYMGSI
ncbi:hypothetical protein CANTEDRAFT_114440 [Yamadazyma tenuis ATCC 10573]|uniref:S-adenosyl-L-methionine-dependent methyltransferase n=1 Tax=Candida tenuis (strain ATCC 10573 / BCRC 21748 / CBS 615 / JCM 9827 / NBRC 10315 / NRRL Y-1498 / VKM Y-70) TaxID=590646 RepID=G3B534_CANTC|nr:uncharacterized protein CANTEDRAFT_114440 [Yamadazyma tenuis ATCC 10573]XP_006686920.1 uncharacterized protein CANTEDRAFT_114440 [Yamadazyma tenuis ATCC 10573]EGV63126.1 hypothetical protein CANTEDRAFT_114440 [Yamadazyma tenuis ATCC 10573]EGV63127.1 hypothetical protein CANTEDRAFT_114440 [Yamadazyma tenuis ATCC 10573]